MLSAIENYEKQQLHKNYLSYERTSSNIITGKNGKRCCNASSLQKKNRSDIARKNNKENF